MENNEPMRRAPEKVVVGNVSTKKKSLGSKITEAFIKEDISVVKTYIVTDVIIPAIKDTVADMITKGVDMLLFGESRGRSNKGPKITNYTSYSSYSTRPDPRTQQAKSRSVLTEDEERRNQNDWENMVFDNRFDAEKVLSAMRSWLAQYDIVSIADLYDLVGKPSMNYTDNNWGWTNLDDADVIRVRGGGYWLKLPKVVSFK